MTYLATSINQSPVIADKAGVAVEDLRGKAVKYDENGAVVLAGAGDAPLGVGIMTNDKNIAAGEDVHIQIKDIALVRTGSAIAKGAELAAGADGKVVPAAGGDYVCAIAMEAASAADIYIKARLVNYKKAVAGVAVTGDTEMRDAIANAADGATITLTNDISITEKLSIDKSLTLDLNGKTISAASDIWAKSGTVTIKNGTVEAAGDAFIVGDYLGGKEKATGDASLVIGEGVTVRVTGDGCNCVYVRSSDHEATVTTSGELIATGKDAAAIQGNGISKGNVTVLGGKVVCENGTAIYHPQEGTLTISGGEVTGKVGIEIRAGELIITGGTVNGGIEEFPGLTANGNGTTATTGAAVVMSQHDTNKPLSATISGGALSGYYALYEEDVQDENGEGIDIHVTGGTFNGRVSSENVTGFVSGGLFSEIVTAEQCAEGFAPAPEPNENGYYTVA